MDELLPAVSVSAEIQRLEAERERHAAAIQEINGILDHIAKALDQARLPMQLSPGDTGGHADHPALPETRDSAGTRRYLKLSTTGEESILALVRQRGTVSTAEINSHWRAEGRRGVANNALGRLLKRGDLAREPVPGMRTSRYRLAAGADQSLPSAYTFSESSLASDASQLA